MRFAFSEEQAAFGESARKAFATTFPESVVRSFTDEPRQQAHWARSVAEAGLSGMLAPEDVGGLGLSLVDAVPVAIEAGRATVPFPVVENMVAAAALASTHPALAAAIVEGGAVAAVDALCTEGGMLKAVPWADMAQWLVGPAGAGTSERLALADLAHATRKPVESFDRTASIADIDLPPGSVRLLDVGAAGFAERIAVLAAAEMVGIARLCVERCVDYARTREQFGKPIGSYQAIKHLLATAAVKLESMLVAVQYAAWAVDSDACDRDLAVLSARTYCASAARDICEDAIQLHGGIGFTWDFGMHFYLRRTIRLAATLGSTATHRERLAGLLFERVESGTGLHA